MGFLKQKVIKLRNKAGTSCANTFKSLFPWVWELKNKYKFDARIRLANMNARRRPKRFFYTSIGIFAAIFLLNLITLIIPKDNKQTETPLEDIPKVHGVIQRMNELQSMKGRHKEYVENLTRQCLDYKTKADSLLRLKNMTKADSVELFRCYTEIKAITTSLNIKINEKN